MKCRSYPTEAALARDLGRKITDLIRRHPTVVLGLPTGRTPLALYAELVRVSEEARLDWSGIRTFNLDEFVGLGTGDDRSYRTFMHERLFKHVNIDPAKIGFLDGRARDLAAECTRYEDAITRAGGIDVLLLGIGANGHIGFNEPTDALVANTHIATLDEPTRAANAWWFGGELQQVPRRALTMGMKTILSARAIALIATGEGKALAVKAMLEGNITTEVPASFLQLHPRVSVMLDQPLADLAGCATQP